MYFCVERGKKKKIIKEPSKISAYFWIVSTARVHYILYRRAISSIMLLYTRTVYKKGFPPLRRLMCFLKRPLVEKNLSSRIYSMYDARKRLSGDSIRCILRPLLFRVRRLMYFRLTYKRESFFK